jgi:hypothetical protein
MSWVGIGVGVAGMGVSAYTSSEASKTAEGASKDAMYAQLAEEQRALAAYQAAVEKAAPLYAPYLKAGKQATGTLAELMRPGGYLFNAPDMNNFRADPAYQNVKNQALESIRSSHAGAGGLYSGQTDLDLMDAAGKLADQAYGQIYQRKVGEQQRLGAGLTGLSDTGKWATGSLADLYTGAGRAEATAYGRMGDSMATGIRGAGDARASGIMGMGSAVNSGLGLGLNAYNASQMNNNYQDLIKRLTPQNTSNFGSWGSGWQGGTGNGPLMSYGN